MEQIYPAPCGLDCNSCKAYKATLEASEERLMKLAEKWSDEKEEYSAEDLRCLGCYSSTLYKGCRSCEVRACTRERGFTNCSLCEEYPCEKLMDEWGSWKTTNWLQAKNYLDEMREKGV